MHGGAPACMHAYACIAHIYCAARMHAKGVNARGVAKRFLRPARASHALNVRYAAAAARMHARSTSGTTIIRAAL